MIDWEDVAMVVGYSLLGLVIVGGIVGIIALQIAYIVSQDSFTVRHYPQNIDNNKEWKTK